MKLMSFQPIWPRGPGMLESLKENAVTVKKPDQRSGLLLKKKPD
jgi:hypothetical protein